MTTVAEDKAALQRDYPEWNFIRTNRGRWYATRGPAPGEFMQPGASCYEADDAEGLREKLAGATQ